MKDKLSVPHTGATEIKAPRPAAGSSNKGGSVKSGKDLRTGGK